MNDSEYWGVAFVGDKEFESVEAFFRRAAGRTKDQSEREKFDMLAEFALDLSIILGQDDNRTIHERIAEVYQDAGILALPGCFDEFGQYKTTKPKPSNGGAPSHTKEVKE